MTETIHNDYNLIYKKRYHTPYTWLKNFPSDVEV